MSAETLRRAAALMRERANAADGSPWLMTRTHRVCREIPGSRIWDTVADVYPVGGSEHQRANASHIAAMHPAVALAAADLLDALAHDREVDPYLPKHFDDAALAVATAYLGETP